ncbi:MAG: 16S rRNA (uracil(1498)-N(3))-methyltransferase [bacterium]|nr:16S rRNA (uracil(1498)-N(3))-methyltransferase [bacterium]
MKLHRFIGQYNLSGDALEITDPETIKQIKLVLRLEVGGHIILSDGQGREAEAEIVSITKDKIMVKVLDIKTIAGSSRNVSLYLAILKKENFELSVQKAVECGVSHIIPVITDRTIKTGLNMERLNKIIREASEQSGRSIVAKLLETMGFTEAVEHGKANNEKVIFHLGDEDYMPTRGNASGGHSVSIFVGPEGGFTENEIKLAKETGYTVSSLGPLTLRGETAAIIATYRAVHGI